MHKDIMLKSKKLSVKIGINENTLPIELIKAKKSLCGYLHFT